MDQVGSELYRVLKNKLTYFKTAYRQAVRMLSLSSPMTVMAAILIYFHSKYGGLLSCCVGHLIDHLT